MTHIRLPSLFVSHGAPTLLLEDVPARRFLAGLAGLLPARPRAILSVTAHFETPRPAVSATERPETIHDFGGFPDELYRLRYPAQGAPELAGRVAALTGAQAVPGRGLDHGTWVPLMLAWPEADIPVAELAVQPGLDATHHYRLGQALAPLADDGVLVLGSGSATHNLRAAFTHAKGAPEPEWSRDFADWLADKVAVGAVDELLDYRARAPEAARAHPTDEHLMPLFVALGAGGGRGERLHESTTWGNLRMDGYRFTG